MFKDAELGEMFLSNHKYWLEYSMSVVTDKGDFTLKWDSEYLMELAYYASCQIGIHPFSFQEFFKQHEKKRQIEWTRNETLGVYDIPKGGKVLDIGCGIGVNAILMHKYDPTLQLSLLDGNDWKGQIGKDREYLDGYQTDYPYYNNWELTKNCIEKSGADINKFKFLDESSEWEQYDLIMSTWSYGFHYPLDTYWDKVLSSLTPGGTLLLDLYHEDDITKVSYALQCVPVVDVRENMYRCIWQTEQVNYG